MELTKRIVASRHGGDWDGGHVNQEFSIMVKASLSGKRRQSTTRLFGMTHQKWVFKASCGIMLIVDGVLTGCIVAHNGNWILNVETGEYLTTESVRVHCSTVSQIRSMIGK